MIVRAAVILLVVLAGIPAFAQPTYSRSRRGSSPKVTGISGTNKTLAGTFRGKLKQITNKEIVIETGEDQVVAIRRLKKTKFYKDGKEIKASDINPGTLVAVDAIEDVDLKPTAVSLMVEKTERGG